MLKLILKNINVYKKIWDYPLLRKFFVFDLEKLETITDEEGFYKAMLPIRMANRITKKTNEHRFSDLDVLSLKYLPKHQSIKIHDVAVSDGITAVEFFDLLTTNQIIFEMYISDKYSKLRHCGRILKKFYDLEGNLIYIDAMGIYISPTATPTHFLSKLMSYAFCWKIGDIHNAKEVLLLNPKTRKYLNKFNLNFIHYDIFQKSPLDFQFDFIKCMNILNLKYFTPDLISQAVTYLEKSLNEGGILLIGRTNREGETNASFFQKFNDRLTLIEDFNSGFELKKYCSVLNCPP